MNDEISEKIEALGREILGSDGWHKDPEYAIRRVLARHPELSPAIVFDILEDGIAIGVTQFGW